MHLPQSMNDSLDFVRFQFVSGVLLSVWFQFCFSIDGIHGWLPILSRSERVATGDGSGCGRMTTLLYS
jgi:hypothetical protein